MDFLQGFTSILPYKEWCIEHHSSNYTHYVSTILKHNLQIFLFSNSNLRVLFSLSTIGLLRHNTKMLFMCRLCTSYLTICTNVREVAVYIIALCENAAPFVKH